MTKKGFNHEQAALADIVARPEVTGQPETIAQADAAAPATTGKAGIKPAEPESEDRDFERDGRLIAGAFSSIFKTLKGGELNKDHASAVSDFGSYLSSALRDLGMSRGFYVAFLGVVLAAPLVPIAFNMLKARGENGSE